MSELEYRDFVDEMYWSVREEAMLHEPSLGAVDRLPGGDGVHRPWRPEDCSRVLSTWHSESLLFLYRYNEDGSNGPDVDATEIAAIVGDPSRWIRPRSHADVLALCVTTYGESVEADGWRARVSNVR